MHPNEQLIVEYIFFCSGLDDHGVDRALGGRAGHRGGRDRDQHDQHPVVRGRAGVVPAPARGVQQARVHPGLLQQQVQAPRAQRHVPCAEESRLLHLEHTSSSSKLTTHILRFF